MVYLSTIKRIGNLYSIPVVSPEYFINNISGNGISNLFQAFKLLKTRI